VSRYGFTGAGCAWQVGYDDPSASFYAYADPQTHRFDVDTIERGLEHWAVAWDDEVKAIGCSRTEGPAGPVEAPTEYVASLDQLVEATGGQVPASVRHELAQAIALPRFEFEDRADLITHDDLLAVIAPLVHVPDEVRARLAADDPFNPTGERDVISDAINALSIEHAAAVLEAAQAGVPLDSTSPITGPVEDAPDLPQSEDGRPVPGRADDAHHKRSPQVGDLVRRLEVLVEPVADLAATIEQPQMRHGPTMHN
jgi:hypothetical protein